MRIKCMWAYMLTHQYPYEYATPNTKPATCSACACYGYHTSSIGHWGPHSISFVFSQLWGIVCASSLDLCLFPSKWYVLALTWAADNRWVSLFSFFLCLNWTYTVTILPAHQSSLWMFPGMHSLRRCQLPLYKYGHQVWLQSCGHSRVLLRDTQCLAQLLYLKVPTSIVNLR